MFLKGETLPTPCLIILSKEREVKRKDVDGSGSGHLLCLSAQLLRLLLLLTALRFCTGVERLPCSRSQGLWGRVHLAPGSRHMTQALLEGTIQG